MDPESATIDYQELESAAAYEEYSVSYQTREIDDSLIYAAVPVISAAAALGKAAVGGIGNKMHYRNNLKKNYEKLEIELNKLVSLANDIENGCIAKVELRNLSTYKDWEKRIWSIQEEVKALLTKYETTKFHKSRLSREFEKKRAEVTHLINEGYYLIKQFPCN